MDVDSLLALLKTGVSQVSGVQPSNGGAFADTPSVSPQVSGVAATAPPAMTDTPDTPVQPVGYQPKPIQDKACTPDTPATPEKINSETARAILADIVSDIGDEAALPAVLEWYADDHDDIARLPRDFVAAMVREYLKTHRGLALSAALPAPVQCGSCTHWRECRPHLGHCAKGHRHAIAGNWDTTWRHCGDYADA